MVKSSKLKAKKFKKNSKKKVSKFEFFKTAPKTVQGFLFRNILIGFIFFIAIQNLYNNNKGYKWVYENLLINNLQLIKKHPEYTIANKYEVKLGYYGKYINYIAENTPDTAVILMPSDSIVKSLDKKLRMDWLSSKKHCEYFLYPRKPIYLNSERDSVYLDKITHVAIVNSHGYEHLKYRVKNKHQFVVLPLTIEK